MTYQPIKTLEIENYGCVKKAKFELSSIHALIGPNDSGKSTTLRALRTVVQLGPGLFRIAADKSIEPFELMLSNGPDVSRIKIGFSDCPRVRESA